MSSLNKVCLAVLLAFAAASAHGQIRTGDTFPALAGQSLAGGEVPELAGRVAVVDFWASWCAPCRASFPALGRLQAKFGAVLVVVGVSVDEKPGAYAAFVKKMKPAFAVLHDREQKLIATVQVPTMPTSFVLDRSGRVRFVHEGYRGEETEKELRDEVATLLAEEKAP